MTISELLEDYEFRGDTSQALYINDDDPAEDSVTGATTYYLSLLDVDPNHQFTVYKKNSLSDSYVLTGAQIQQLQKIRISESDIVTPETELFNYNQNNEKVLVLVVPSAVTVPDNTVHIYFGLNGEELGYFTVELTNE